MAVEIYVSVTPVREPGWTRGRAWQSISLCSQTARRHGTESRPGFILSAADYTRTVLLGRACAVVWMDVQPWLASVCLRNGGSHLSINIREPTRAGSGTVVQADSWIPSPARLRRHIIDAPLFAYKTSHPNALSVTFHICSRSFSSSLRFCPSLPARLALAARPNALPIKSLDQCSPALQWVGPSN